ncbi:MAG: GNAT family N-acetyltransferase [Halobacteriota archaeon]
MYVRDAKNRDEVWLLEQIESMGLDDEAFRSRDYVIAVDEETNARVGFGRLRVHAADPEVCELTGIGVRPAWRGQGVGAHVVERLVVKSRDLDFDVVYSLTDEPAYLEQFGFERVAVDELPEPLGDRFDTKRSTVSEAIVPLRLEGEFEMPDRFREAFKTAEADDGSETEPSVRPEDFGIDPDEATYKYDTGQ